MAYILFQVWIVAVVRAFSKIRYQPTCVDRRRCCNGFLFTKFCQRHVKRALWPICGPCAFDLASLLCSLAEALGRASCVVMKGSSGLNVATPIFRLSSWSRSVCFTGSISFRFHLVKFAQHVTPGALSSRAAWCRWQHGRIQMKSYLHGNPDLVVGLNLRHASMFYIVF